MRKGRFSREFKLEAVRLVKGRDVAVAQAARDVDRSRERAAQMDPQFADNPQHAFPGHGQMKLEQLEIDRLRKEVAKLKGERDI